MKKRIISLLLILVFVLTNLCGCSNDTGKATGQLGSQDKQQTDDKKKDKEEITMGRYMEHKITLPDIGANESIVKILENKNKQIEAYTLSEGKYLCYQLQKDMSWEKTEPGWLNDKSILTDSKIIQDLCIGNDGNYYALTVEYSNNTAKNMIVKSADGETLQKVKIPYLEEETSTKGYKHYPSIDKIQVMGDGSIVLHNMWEQDRLFVFSPDGKKIDKLQIGVDDNYPTKNFIATEKYIITINEDCTGVVFYDPIQKSVERIVEFNDRSGYIAFALKQDGTLFMGNSGGIHRLQKGGNLWETIVDGTLNSMSMPTFYFDALFVTEGEQEEYYGVYSTEESGYQLMQYVYDKNVASVPSKEITVYSLKENKTVRQAISMFHAKNPDIKVSYVVAMGDETENTTDYIRALNTELLAGNGADILILDGLPVDSYIEKGVLSDISEVLNPLDTAGELMTNITNCYKEDGKIYRMPLRFSVPVIAGKPDAVQAAESLTSIVDYINKDNSRPYYDNTTYIQLLQECLALYSKDLIENNQLNEDNMKAFLKDVKSLAQGIEIDESSSYSTPVDIKRWLFDSNELFQGDVLSIIKRSQAALIQVNNIENTVLLFAATRDKDNNFQTVNQYFLPSGMVGLNNKAKEADIARQFIRFLFEQETQDANVYDGFPVNKEAMENWINREKDLYYGFIDDEGTELNGEWPQKEERESFYQLIKNLNQPIDRNPLLDEIIIEAAIPYLKGETDESQTLTAMKAKINTYLAE